jgi:hypothetical protein
MSAAELSFVMDQLVTKSRRSQTSIAEEVGLSQRYIENVILGRAGSILRNDPERGQEVHQKLVEIFALTEPHRTFFLGLCQGKYLSEIARETGLPIPLDYIKPKHRV